MTMLFLAHTTHDAISAQTLRQALEAQGYTCWRAPGYATPATSTYPRIIEYGILGSAALVLLWNESAARDDEVTRQLVLAQRLHRPVVPVVVDQTPLPHTLRVSASVIGALSSYDTVAQLLTLLPAADSLDPLLTCAEQAARESISARKTAIELATGLLARNEHREEVLALLDYLARHDLITGVREKAQEALDAEAQKRLRPSDAPALPLQEDERHLFAATCSRCGHTSQFDKRRVCAAQGPILRHIGQTTDKKLDTLQLSCAYCTQSMLVQVDCDGY